MEKSNVQKDTYSTELIIKIKGEYNIHMSAHMSKKKHRENKSETNEMVYPETVDRRDGEMSRSISIVMTMLSCALENK